MVKSLFAAADLLEGADTPCRLLRAGGHNQLAFTKRGYVLYNRNDQYIGRAIEEYGESSALELNLIMQFIFPTSVVIEVGANIGTHTLAFANAVGPGGRVLAFEPQRLVFQTLCANVALNSLVNVDCYNAAAGNSEEPVNVPDLDPTRENNFGGLSVSGNTSGIKVPCMKLDGFDQLRAVQLIKIDVEGMEADVLLGGKRLIEKFKPVLYVENDRIEKSEALLRLINSMGYRMYWHCPALFNPDNYFGNPNNSFGQVVSFNLLCLHRTSGHVITDAHPIEDFSQHPLLKFL